MTHKKHGARTDETNPEVVVFAGIDAIGCAQMIWIVVELAIIQGISILHPLYFLTGLGIAAAAVPWGWPTFQGWRAARRCGMRAAGVPGRGEYLNA